MRRSKIITGALLMAAVAFLLTVSPAEADKPNGSKAYSMKKAVQVSTKVEATSKKGWWARLQERYNKPDAETDAIMKFLEDNREMIESNDGG